MNVRSSILMLCIAFSCTSANAGKVIIGGDDLALHGFHNLGAGTDHQGWLYIEKALTDMFAAGCITRINDGTIAALGVTNSTAAGGGDAGAAIHYAAQELSPPRTVTYIEGAAAINTYLAGVASGANNPAVIWIATNHGASNDLDDAETDALAANASTLANFVNTGGALMAHTEDAYPGGNPWLGTVIPGLTEVVNACQVTGAMLTPAGTAAFPGLLNSDITAGPCHSTFTNIGSLTVLAVDGLGRNLIIGGDCGTVIGPCTPTSTLTINTGWEQGQGILSPEGDVDNEWVVVSDPSVFLTTEPRPAFTIPPYYPAWAPPQASSRWISSFPTADNDVNGHYVFEYRFCLETFLGAGLDVSLRADDQASVYLNGNFMGSTGPHSFNQPPLIITTNFFDWGKFNSGENVLRVDVENTQNVAMGFNLVGTITGQVPRYHYCCTDAASGLLGRVWLDTNQNGVKDGSEAMGKDWTVNLLSGATIIQTTTTDGLGNYYFLELVPGTYNVAPVDKFGMAPTTAASYTVTLGLGEIVPDLNFGFRKVKLEDLPWPHQYPNPFNPQTTIAFTLRDRGSVSLKVYDVSGQLVRTLADEELAAGSHSKVWDGHDGSGKSVASGVYFYKLVTNEFSQTRKMVLLK